MPEKLKLSVVVPPLSGFGSKIPDIITDTGGTAGDKIPDRGGTFPKPTSQFVVNYFSYLYSIKKEGTKSCEINCFLIKKLLPLQKRLISADTKV